MNKKSEKTHIQQDVVIKTFIAGGVAGCCAKSAVAPFDRVKILLQAHHTQFKNLGIFSTVSKIVQVEGAIALYKGNSVQMVRIFPYGAIQFASYEQYKQIVRKYFGNGQLSKLMTGSLAGLTAVIFTYPLDVIRARLAFQVSSEVVYTGLLNAVRVIVTREGGLCALYKGIVPTMIGIAPYAGLSFYSYDTLKSLLLQHFREYTGTPCPGNDGSYVLTLPAKLLCGGVAGAMAQTVSYPLDVARRRMQLSEMLPGKHKFNTLHKTLELVLREHGVRRGLYRGLCINYLKVTPTVSISFTTYELLKQWMGLDTHNGGFS